MESVSLAIFNPINRTFGLGLVTPVDTVGRAMHKVAQDDSIKPKEAENSKKSAIGSLASIFTNADIHFIGDQK